MSKYRATIKQWGDITGIIVLDPDGFDRKDRHLMERLFTYDEFMHGCMTSTVQRPRYNPDGDRLLDPPIGLLPFDADLSKKGKLA